MSVCLKQYYYYHLTSTTQQHIATTTTPLPLSQMQFIVHLSQSIVLADVYCVRFAQAQMMALVAFGTQLISPPLQP